MKKLFLLALLAIPFTTLVATAASEENFKALEGPATASLGNVAQITVPEG